MLLVKFKSNYADEFDVEGFKIYNDDEEFSKAIHDFIEDKEINPKKEFEWYFGSNESIEFENVDDLLHCFKTIYINDVTADHLKGLFNGRKFGIFPL